MNNINNRLDFEIYIRSIGFVEKSLLNYTYKHYKIELMGDSFFLIEPSKFLNVYFYTDLKYFNIKIKHLLRSIKLKRLLSL